MDFPGEKITGYSVPEMGESADFIKGFNDAHRLTWQSLNELDPNEEQTITRSLKIMMRETMYAE